MRARPCVVAHMCCRAYGEASAISRPSCAHRGCARRGGAWARRAPRRAGRRRPAGRRRVGVACSRLIPAGGLKRRGSAGDLLSLAFGEDESDLTSPAAKRRRSKRKKKKKKAKPKKAFKKLLRDVKHVRDNWKDKNNHQELLYWKKYHIEMDGLNIMI